MQNVMYFPGILCHRHTQVDYTEVLEASYTSISFAFVFSRWPRWSILATFAIRPSSFLFS